MNEGQRDVEEAKAAGAGYIEQAKQVINDGATAAKVTLIMAVHYDTNGIP